MLEDRFRFGKNWSEYLQNLDDEKISIAMQSLIDWLQMENLNGKTFLDIGSGSGLFSLAARKLGARVYSFDYDKDSVECTRILRERYFPDDSQWSVEQGDALNKEYLKKYGECDVVYSWGVLHHTGNMYKGLENAGDLVKSGGKLFIAIYNDEGKWSDVWKFIKKTYNSLPGIFKWIILLPCFVRLWGPTTIKDFMRLQPFHTWREYKKKRGMSPWHDVVDWVGGWPFEVARPDEIFDFFHERGFELKKMFTGGGHGCNQFVFVKQIK